MKLVLTPQSIKQINEFEKYEDVSMYILGIKNFSLRMTYQFSLEEILNIDTKKEVYVGFNKILHNSELEEVTKILIALDKSNVSGIIFSDLAILQIIKENNLQLLTIYSTETTITNKYFNQFAKSHQITGLDLAKEITLEEAKEISEDKQIKTMFNIHGHIYMYQSIRKMVSNYQEYLNKEFSNEEPLYLYDDERDVYYPLIEDEQGTHLLAHSDLCLIGHLDKVVGFDYLKIDSFLYEENEYQEIVDVYVRAIKMDREQYVLQKEKLKNEVKMIIPKKEYSTGFCFKKTIY